MGFTAPLKPRKGRAKAQLVGKKENMVGTFVNEAGVAA